MLNSCTFVGRLSKDVELRFTPNGKAVANFTLAVKREVADQKGDYHTDFFNFVVWGRPAENMANQLSKGDVIGIESRAQQRSYDGQDGKKVYVTEFLVAGFPKYIRVKKWENGSGKARTDNSQSDPFAGDPPYEISDDDLPF